MPFSPLASRPTALPDDLDTFFGHAPFLTNGNAPATGLHLHTQTVCLLQLQSLTPKHCLIQNATADLSISTTKSAETNWCFMGTPFIRTSRLVTIWRRRLPVIFKRPVTSRWRFRRRRRGQPLVGQATKRPVSRREHTIHSILFSKSSPVAPGPALLSSAIGLSITRPMLSFPPWG